MTPGVIGVINFDVSNKSNTVKYEKFLVTEMNLSVLLLKNNM